MPRKRSRKKSKGRKKQRRHRTDKLSHARRRHARTRRHGHHKRMIHETQMLGHLLQSILKTQSASEDKPYHWAPRHPTRDPEHKWSGQRMRDFKAGFPAPDFSMLRSQGDAVPPHRGNFPDWQAHPHAGRAF